LSPATPALIAPALAQDRFVEVPTSVVGDLSPQGVRLGSNFVARPRMGMDLRFDSNIYNRSSAQDDLVIVVRPQVRIASDFARHSVRLDGAAESRRYRDNKRENSDQWSAQASGTLDLADRFLLASQVGLARRIERRGTFGDQFLTDEPVAYDEVTGGVALSRMGGVLEWQARAGTRKLTYKDARLGAVPLDQSGRDVRRDLASLRIDYGRSRRLGLFTRITATQLKYDAGASRGSRGISLIVGASYQVTGLLELEAGAGFVHQNDKNAQIADIKALDYNVNVSWTPSPRLRFELQGARNVERSPFTFASSVLQSTLLANGQLAVGSRTLLRLEAGAVQDRYRGADRRETTFYGEVSAHRRITRNLAGLVGLSGRKQTGSGPTARRYDGTAVRVGIDVAF
jgi:hypothetical protein